MNYAIFVSLGVFAALFLIIATQLSPDPDQIAIQSPKQMALQIKAEQRKRVLIAQQEHGIEVKPIQTASTDDAPKQIFINSSGGESLHGSSKSQQDEAPLPPDSLYELLKEIISRAVSVTGK